MVKRTASEDYFYELPIYLQNAVRKKFGEDDFNLVETTLSGYEDIFSKYYKEFLKELGESKDLSIYLMNEQPRGWISFFVTVQFFRTKKWRNTKQNEYAAAYDKVNKPLGNILDDWNLHNYR
ncbi:DUF4238 domain-containing protein [Metabacillus sp. FJAT-52054]|uniref:DUF4238 domain-containing protein n=1 Tax=Metabacillus sediminis TaxID=3117746 RepID=A0ABZ2NFX4_9BACI